MPKGKVAPRHARVTRQSARLQGRAGKSPKHTGKERMDAAQGSKRNEQSNLDERQGKVYLRIDKSFLSPACALPQDTQHLYIISDTLQALSPYCGTSCSWLIHISKLICEPHGTGELHTFRTRDSDYWHSRRYRLSSWKLVNEEDNLEAKIYEYRPAATTVALARICAPRNQTDIERSHGSANTFRYKLLNRDTHCIVANDGLGHRAIASHLIPRRLGNVIIRDLIATYTRDIGINIMDIHAYHPILGVMLNRGLDSYVDKFDAGFLNRAVSNLISVGHNLITTEIFLHT